MMCRTNHKWILASILLLVALCHTAAGSTETMDEEVKENPVEEALDNGLSDLMKSISTIQNRLKNITNTSLGNFTGKFDEEIQNGLETITKDVTYDNLIEKIKQAKNKIKEIHNKVSSTMSDLENNWPEANITRQDEMDDEDDSGGTEEDFVSVSS
uniref:Histidinol dehydrogenase n=1 Tax=Lygus hesperus TaxID=30085 RepID=A0A0A9X5C3_LYGHE